MVEKINPVLLEKYLNGDDLSQAEFVMIEKILTKEEALATEVAKDLTDITLSETLKKGIQQAGKVGLKKKVNKIKEGLEQRGFFLDETDIHHYLKGTLAEEKITIFENRLEQEKAFVEKVEKEQKLLSGLKRAGQQQLRDKLSKVQTDLTEKGFFEEQAAKVKDTPKSNKVVGIFSSRNLAIAASFLILVVAYFNYPKQNTVDFNQTFANHFPYEDKISDILKDEISEIGYAGNDKVAQEQLLAALAMYNQQKYGEAIPLFKQVLSEKPKQLYAQFYLGQSQLNLENWKEAIQHLQPLGQSINFPLRADALWGTSFSLLKATKNEEAKLLLQQLSQFENPYQTAANNLLQAL